MSTHNEIVDELGFGIVPNIFSVADAAPEAQTGLWQAFRRIVLRGQLPRTVKEMMGVIISRRNESRYAAEVHLHALMVQGIEDPLIQALSEGRIPDNLAPRTAALLTFAFHSAGPNPDPASIRHLEGAELSDAERMEAVAVAALFRMVNAWTDLQSIPLDEI